MAADLFPHNYSGLAAALLDALDEIAPERRTEVLRETAHQLASDAGDLPDDPEARLDAIIQYLKSLGFISRWEKTDEGEYRLYTCNCPYHYVSQVHPETCQIDEFMLRELLNGKVVREEGKASDDSLCEYRIAWSVEEQG
jgi:predicted ArsR family transcriptional regulator